MTPIKDLTGQRFGRLVALRLLEKRAVGQKAVWECQCDCGNIVCVASTSLCQGATKSCGCIVIENNISRTKDLSGNIYGRLIVLRRSKYKPSLGHNTCWLCRCECGAFVLVRRSDLQSGKTQSCGCLHREIASKIHITHGMSNTVEYANNLNRKRRDLRLAYDWD